MSILNGTCTTFRCCKLRRGTKPKSYDAGGICFQPVVDHVRFTLFGVEFLLLDCSMRDLEPKIG